MEVGDAQVFPGFLTPVLTQISFQSHRLLFSHASAEVRGENTPVGNFASTGSRTRNHQVMSPTRSPQSLPGGAKEFEDYNFVFDENGRQFSKQAENTVGKGEIVRNEQFFPFPIVFSKDLYSRHVKTRKFGNGLKSCAFSAVLTEHGYDMIAIIYI